VTINRCAEQSRFAKVIATSLLPPFHGPPCTRPTAAAAAARPTNHCDKALMYLVSHSDVSIRMEKSAAQVATQDDEDN